MSVDDLAVLAIPAVLVTGLVLLGLGLDGRGPKARPRGGVGGVTEWATPGGGGVRAVVLGGCGWVLGAGPGVGGPGLAPFAMARPGLRRPGRVAAPGGAAGP